MMLRRAAIGSLVGGFASLLVMLAIDWLIWHQITASMLFGWMAGVITGQVILWGIWLYVRLSDRAGRQS